MMLSVYVKGVTSMRHIHPDFKSKKVLTYIADLIIEYGYDHYYDMSEGDKAGLAVLLNQQGGRSDEFSCITQGAHSDQIINAFRKSLNGDREDDINFLETIKENVINYYDYTMKCLFDYVNEDFRLAKNEWLDHLAKEGDPDQAYDKYRENLA